MTKQKILIVEDDLHLGFLLMELLESEGFEVKLCRDGSSGLQSFKQAHFDCCLLDVMLPETDGFQLALRIRQENAQTPFLFLTARTVKADRLRGFTLGADDYITKPFDEEELLCRIRVILRRYADDRAVKPIPTHFLSLIHISEPTRPY